jgi:His/Glu/Gln/Arg/opine family amino acid ABC transporter permease subunit
MKQWLSDFADKFYLNFIAQNRYLLLLNGLKITIYVTLGAVILGILLGVIVALMRISKNRILSGIAGVYLTVIRGTPSLIQLMIIYYVVFSGIRISQVLVAIIAFGINSGAYVGEIVRAGIQSIDKGQTEASRSLGLNHAQTMLYIILPQAFRNILPALANEVITLMKETSIVGYIALQDLTRAGDYIRSRTFNAYMPLLAVAVIYLGMTMLLSAVFKNIERRMHKNDSH